MFKKKKTGIGKIFILGLILFLFIICAMFGAVYNFFFGDGTTYTLPEIIGRGTNITDPYSFSNDDDFDNREFKWTIIKAQSDVKQMQKSETFKTSLGEDNSDKAQKWRKKVMATAVIYEQFIEGYKHEKYVIPEDDENWWKDDDKYNKYYYAEILGKADYSSEEWLAYTECFTGDDWTESSYNPMTDDTFSNLEALLGIEIKKETRKDIIECANIMAEVVLHSYYGSLDLYGEDFKLLPWTSDECQELWDEIFNDHYENLDTLWAGWWERNSINPTDVGDGPQCTTFASWRCFKQYGHGTAGGNGDEVAEKLVKEYPDEFILSKTPAAGAIGSGRGSDGSIHVFYVESYDEERGKLNISEGNVLAGSNYHGIRLNHTVSLDELHETFDSKLEFACPKGWSNQNGSNLQNK